MQGFFFDMDGVLFDSMPHHAQAWEIVMSRHGLPFTQRDCYLQEGCTGYDVIYNTIQRCGDGRHISDAEIDAIYREKSEMFVSLGGATPMRGVAEVLQTIHRHADKQIWIVTGSAQMTLFEQLNNAFPAIFARERMITALECPHGKPLPDPYLKAWEGSGLRKDTCCVIENAPLGCRAAKAAGLYTIVVNTGPLEYADFASCPPDLFLPDMRALADILPTLLS